MVASYYCVVLYLYAHVVIMLYACVVSSCCCKLGLYACASVFKPGVHWPQAGAHLVS